MTGLFFKAKIGHLLPDFIFYSRSTAWLQAVEKVRQPMTENPARVFRKLFLHRLRIRSRP